MSKYLSMLIKPASGMCNAQCKYCFYRDVSRGRVNPVMSPDTARALIDKALYSCDEGGCISFSFQGGEPTLAGLGFFNEFVSYVSSVSSIGEKNISVSYSIQTNGLVIDENWTSFFKNNCFLVGLSIDGPQKIHDSLRGEGTHASAVSAYEQLTSSGVETNILTVVTKPLARRVSELFDFYVKNHMNYVQIIPCLDPMDGSRNGWSLSPRIYADFLKDLCNIWFDSIKKGVTVRIRLFDNLILMLNGYPPEQCGLDGICRNQYVCESNGDIYPCDFYCVDTYKMGNILYSSIDELSQRASGFLSPLPVPDKCSACKAKGICAGNCKRYRSFFFRDGNYCPMQDFIYSSYPKLYEVAHKYTHLTF